MTKKPKRARTARREADREQQKLGSAARRLHELEPGGSPDHPLEVPTPSVVEVDATSRRCGACGGETRLVDHTVAEHDGRRLRVVRVTCKGCRAEWRWFYRIAAPN